MRKKKSGENISNVEYGFERDKERESTIENISKIYGIKRKLKKKKLIKVK